MPIEQPDQLSGYKRDSAAEFKALLPARILGPVILLSFIGTPIAFVLARPIAGIVCIVVCLSSAVALVFLGGKNRTRRCPQCGAPADTVDIGLSCEQYNGSKRRYPGVIIGADEQVYYAHSRKSSGGSGGVMYVIGQLKRRWCACGECEVCFLAVEVLREEVYKTNDSKKWKQACELVKSDPEAIEAKKVFQL
ncbi:MAG: hypothetical protein QGG42_13815 [Phycisphaerae bacterium]|jgi:hypothetical protein|nr:hypothetical protein [Phycisphaerae bacterium]